jgi:alpha-beta hydrolase superfamily lysophospholipase
VTWPYLGRRDESPQALAGLSEAARAGLAQFGFERLLGYGMAYADAVEMRARVLEGVAWAEAAVTVAESILGSADTSPAAAGDVTRALAFRRAAALLRMSQVLMVTDTPERRAVYARAVELYDAAARMRGDRTRVRIETDQGPLAGWLVPAQGPVVGAALVLGGLEGWAMDFDSTGDALAARGVDALLLDGPGQGETRLAFGHFLSAAWPSSYRDAIDYLAGRAQGRPIAVVGNSLGGAFAMGLAAADARIAACCNNGGPLSLAPARAFPPAFAKFVAMCGGADWETTAGVLDSVDPVAPGPGVGYPLLIVQGARDVLVSTAASELLLQRAPTHDKQMLVFADGDHCIYNHRDDRDAVIADWIRSRLNDRDAERQASPGKGGAS